MSAANETRFELLLSPLRFDPELTASIIYALKWSLGAMFPDPFSVRDVVVAVREIVDNVMSHAEWGRPPGPTFAVRLEHGKGRSVISVSSSNHVRDVEVAKKSVRLIEERLSGKSPTELYRDLSAKLIDSGDRHAAGGIGLMQVASSPRCRLRVRLDSDVFHVRVEVDVPELVQPSAAGDGSSSAG